MIYWQRIVILLRSLVLSLVLVVMIAPEWPAFQGERTQLNSIIGRRHFDFVVWEARALLNKVEAGLAAGHRYLDQAERRQLVLDYLALLGEIRRLEGQINDVYADPATSNPATAAAGLQGEVAARRVRLAEMQPLAEAIVEEQVAAVLLGEGFGFVGRIWPPVQMHMTPLPLVLIISPRDEIRQLHGLPLTHGLSIPTQEVLEAEIYETIDRSALVVPIGGLGIYPAMIVETSSVNFLADVVAHEWAHHWLSLRPLGLKYAASGELRTINETVASIVGKEAGEAVIARFYPEYAPQPAPPAAEAPAPAEGPAPFDFRAEMAQTRTTVDDLLAEGRIEAAEAYMEARRRYIVANGYNLRKLNQAYFAFYGAYADTPGATGSDPIGPTVVAIREQSPNLRVFLERVAPVTSLAELTEVLERLHSPTG